MKFSHSIKGIFVIIIMSAISITLMGCNNLLKESKLIVDNLYEQYDKLDELNDELQKEVLVEEITKINRRIVICEELVKIYEKDLIESAEKLNEKQLNKLSDYVSSVSNERIFDIWTK